MTDQPTTTESTRVTTRWTYLGVRVNRDDKLAGLWLPFEPATGCPQQLESDALWFEGKAGTSGVIGGVYDVEHVCVDGGEDAKYTMYGTPKWTGDRGLAMGDRAFWQAREYDAKDRKTALSAHKKAKDHDELLEGLEPLRIAYMRTNAQGKRALMARVIEALNRRTTLVK